MAHIHILNPPTYHTDYFDHKCVLWCCPNRIRRPLFYCAAVAAVPGGNPGKPGCEQVANYVATVHIPVCVLNKYTSIQRLERRLLLGILDSIQQGRQTGIPDMIANVHILHQFPWEQTFIAENGNQAPSFAHNLDPREESRMWLFRASFTPSPLVWQSAASVVPLGVFNRHTFRTTIPEPPGPLQPPLGRWNLYRYTFVGIPESALFVMVFRKRLHPPIVANKVRSPYFSKLKEKRKREAQKRQQQGNKNLKREKSSKWKSPKWKTPIAVAAEPSRDSGEELTRRMLHMNLTPSPPPPQATVSCSDDDGEAKRRMLLMQITEPVVRNRIDDIALINPQKARECEDQILRDFGGSSSSK